MHLAAIPTDDASLKRVTRELWLPYHRELAATAEGHGLVEDTDLVAAEVAFRRDWLETDGQHGWVALAEAPADMSISELVGGDAELLGFVTTQVDTAPSVFTRPDRLVIGDIYVVPPARGDSVAESLVARAVAAAEEAGCAELALDVDVDNERARAFYRRLGFEPIRHRLTAPVETVSQAIDTD